MWGRILLLLWIAAMGSVTDTRCRCKELTIRCGGTLNGNDLNSANRKCPGKTKVRLRNIRDKTDFEEVSEFLLNQEWISQIDPGKAFCERLTNADENCYGLGAKFRICGCPGIITLTSKTISF